MNRRQGPGRGGGALDDRRFGGMLAGLAGISQREANALLAALRKVRVRV